MKRAQRKLVSQELPALMQTERLSLRRVKLSDRAFCDALLQDPEVRRVEAGRVVLTADESFKEYIAAQSTGAGYYIVSNRSSGQQIGLCGIFRSASTMPVAAGYIFLSAFHGYGYATESMKVLLDEFFKVSIPDRVAFLISQGHEKSIAVAKRAGAVLTRIVSDTDGKMMNIYECGKPGVVIRALDPVDAGLKNPIVNSRRSDPDFRYIF